MCGTALGSVSLKSVAARPAPYRRNMSRSAGSTAWSPVSVFAITGNTLTMNAATATARNPGPNHPTSSGAIVGELVAGFAEDSPGLGIIVMASFKQFETDLLFAAILSSTALGIVMFSAVNLAGARILGRFSPSDKEGPQGREAP